MPFYTPNYQLGAVVVGETLSPLMDSQRFLTIDRQLLGLFQVFGNGIIAGWNVVAGGILSVSISPGRGNINFMAAQTTIPAIVTGLTPNAVNYIYAQATDTTQYDMSVRFYSDVVEYNSGQQILLAAVTTNASTVISVDTTVANNIGFIAEIQNLINQHKHRGPPNNPTQIDLSAEVMGQLPGYRLGSLDASQVTSGRLKTSRLPKIEHSALLHSGILTHAQLDSFVRNLSDANVRLLGELSASNMLQLYLAFKHTWSEVDAYAGNLLAIIPGISPDSFTDPATTAVIDKVNHTIQGIPSLGGQLVTTTFSTQNDFSSAKLMNNIYIGGTQQGTAYFQLTLPVTELVVDNFDTDNVFSTDTAIPGWTVTTIPVQNSTTFVTDDTEQVDGAFSAKFSVSEQIRVQATKMFTTAADWSPYNQLEAYVQTLSPDHGDIIFQILTHDANGNPIELDHFTLLQANKTTTGFLRVTRDISTLVRTSIWGINIYTETGDLRWDLSSFSLNIDSISLNNNLYYSPTGLIRFRLHTPQSSQWADVSWVGSANGGSIQAKARSASSFAVFDQSSAVPFGPLFGSGSSPKVDNNPCIEIEIDLVASPDYTATPVVDSVTVSYITNAQNGGLTIEGSAAFLRATSMANATVVPDVTVPGYGGNTTIPGYVEISGRVDVGDLVYGQQYNVQQTSLSKLGGIYSYGTPVLGIDGTQLPLSPFEAAQTNYGLRQSSLNGVAAVERLQDRTYLVADALNDRIVIFDSNGKFVQGFVSNNVMNVTALYPLVASYNPVTTTLFIAWSANVSLATLDLTQMTIQGPGLSITLSNTADTVSQIVGPQAQTFSNVSPVVLSASHAGQISDYLSTGGSSRGLYINISSTAATGMGLNPNAATLTTPQGMPMFIGDMNYVGGIYRPISVSVTPSGTWLIGNAKPLTTSGGLDPMTGMTVSNITSVIELDPSTGTIVFSDNSIDFSLLTLGAAVEINGQYVGEAGIVSKNATTTGTATSGASGASGVSGVSGTAGASLDSQASTDVNVLSSYVGVVKIVEKTSGQVVFQQNTSDGTYAADMQLDENGYIVTIEKSFANGATGIGRVIKMDSDGNIFFQFGLAEMASPNDVRVLSTGNMMVST